MATATDLISNQGNAELGLGSHPEIPVGSNVNMDALLDIGNNIMLQNMAQNKYLFDQKVKDRDKLLSAINSGDIKVGDLLEEDMPYVRSGLDDLDEAWEKMVKKGRFDINAQAAYRKVLREATDRVTQAQGRKVFNDQETGALSKETLPRKQEARKQNLEKSLKSFWSDPTPYQQTQDLNIEKDIISTAKSVATQFRDPKNPLFKVSRVAFDYGKTYAASLDNFLNDDDKRNSQLMLRQEVEKLPPDQAKKAIDEIDAAITRYNDERGLQAPNLEKGIAGDQGYVQPLTIVTDPNTGAIRIQDKAPDFAAKYTLAHQKPFTAETDEFDAKYANYLAALDRNKAAKTRAYWYGRLSGRKLADMDAAEKRIVGFWGNIVNNVKEMDAIGAGDKLIGKRDFIYHKDLPEGHTYMNGVDKDGKPIQLKPLIKTYANGQKTTYYNLKYNNGMTGEPMTKEFLVEQYNANKKAGYKGGYNAYVKQLISEGKVDLEVIGANGTANVGSALEAARAVSNKATSKGEEPIFETDEVEMEAAPPQQ